MAKFDPQHAVVPPANFGDKNSAERFLECGKFRRCANLTLIFGHQHNPPVSVYLPVCRESRFDRTGMAQMLPIPIANTPISPVTYTTVAHWAPLISCPRDCKSYRSQRWTRILRWLRPKATQEEVPTSGVLSDGWVQGFGVASVLTFAAFVAAVMFRTAVQAAVVAFLTALIPTLIAIVIVSSRTPKDRESDRNKPNQSPERGDHHRPPQLWEAVSNKFKNLVDQPIPIWGEWIYTFETQHYQWSINHPSGNAVKLCIEICKEAGRLLLAEPSFRQKFPEIAAITDDGDRWLLAVYKVAGIGKVRASNLRSSTTGGITTGEGGQIKDLPGASQVLCQMALNGF